MAIKPPAWCSFAVPTQRGWEDPHSGELLVSSRHSQDQINEWHGIPTSTPMKEAAAVEPELLIEEGEDDDLGSMGPDLENMTKKELEALGREHGVELDRRKSKVDLVEELRELGID
tara:strand:- start:1364 stop:1711 length:348 start_codon:yes stop_codon:yes gene_type:complete